jgi:hypothetical protein
VSLTLANEFAAVGHEVKVITTTRAENEDRSFPFTVDRRPSARRLFELTLWCDVYFHNNISLQYVWPLLILRRPWVIAHHTWIARKDESIGWQDRVKQFILRFGTNISISRPVADHLSTPSLVIGNPYQDHLFCRDPKAERNRALIFVGRLGEEKGVHFSARIPPAAAGARTASRVDDRRFGAGREESAGTSRCLRLNGPGQFHRYPDRSCFSRIAQSAQDNGRPVPVAGAVWAGGPRRSRLRLPGHCC